MLFIISFCVLFAFHCLAEPCPELTGRAVFPQDTSYNQARLTSNYFASKDRFPKGIVYCRTTQDVQNAIRWAHCHKFSIRVRSGGHHHEGFSSGSEALVIDVSEMKELHIDKTRRIAKVQPGITGGELYEKLFKEWFTQVGGTCKDVGISGLVLTGGMGPLIRKHGLACDNLISFEMVNAKGEVIRATADNEHKDLFWAACGAGGGNFGIVTELELKIYPASQVTWFNIGWDWNQPIDKVIAAWQNFYLQSDDHWFSHLDLWSKNFPEEFHKQPVKALGVFYGTPEEAKKGLAPLLNIGRPSDQTIERVDWNKAIKLFEDATATFITDKPEYKSTGAFALQPLPEEAIQRIVKALQHSSTPLLNVLFLGLGGAAEKKAPNETAYFYRKAQFLITYSTQWMQSKDAEKQIREVDDLRERLLPFTQGDYVGNPDRHLKDYLTAYWGDNVPRLKCVKQKYDSENVFQFEQSIPPDQCQNTE